MYKIPQNNYNSLRIVIDWARWPKEKEKKIEREKKRKRRLADAQ
jgi:hypothetical protein